MFGAPFQEQRETEPARRDTGRRRQCACPGDLCPRDPALHQGSETPSTPGMASGQNADSPETHACMENPPPKVETFQRKMWKTSAGKRRISKAVRDFASPGVKSGSKEKASTQSHQAPKGDFLSPLSRLGNALGGAGFQGSNPLAPRLHMGPSKQPRVAVKGSALLRVFGTQSCPQGITASQGPPFLEARKSEVTSDENLSPNGRYICTSEVKSNVQGGALAAEAQAPFLPQLPRRRPSERVAGLLHPGRACAAGASTNPEQLGFPAKGVGPARAPRHSLLSLTDWFIQGALQ